MTSPVTPSAAQPYPASPLALYQRKAAAERRAVEWGTARVRGETSRSSLREAEAQAGRQAAALRAALRELDDAVGELREARRRIGEAAILPKPSAHAACTSGEG